MATHALTQATAPKTYAELKRGVEVALLIGQREIERARVHTYWETGRLINVHILLNGGRAEFGAKVFNRLEKDLRVSKRVLYQCAQFARVFPIVNGRSQLSWAHYRVLCQVEDDPQRKALETEARSQDWNSVQLEARIRELSLLNAPGNGGALDDSTPSTDEANLLVPKRGTPGLYRIVTRGERLAVDLGFKTYRPLTAAEGDGWRDGALVRLDGRGAMTPAVDATKADLFTYRATISRVIDGDTLVIEIELLPRCVVEHKLRLRGLDCPEIDTAEGKSAKRFTATAVAAATEIAIYTTKPDKYDRYLADVFCRSSSGEDVFLNNSLLENGQAVRKDSWEFRDWEKELIG